MAVTQKVVPLSYIAAADLSGKQFYAMKSSGADGKVTTVTAVADRMLGILQNKPTSGQAAAIAEAGVVKWRAGGTLTAGNRVGKHTDGTAVPVGTGVPYDGICVKGCASGELAEVQLTLGGYA